MPKIFISYRRDDSAYQADRLHFALRRAVEDPARDIFIDVDNIPVGVDFVQHLENKVAECDVLLALIGPRWLATDPATGKHRLEDPKDFVRIEIASALKRNIAVVPVLLDGRPFPSEDDLPADLKPLVRRNGVVIRRESFDGDVERLITGLGLKLLDPDSEIGREPPVPAYSTLRKAFSGFDAESRRDIVMCLLRTNVAGGASLNGSTFFERRADAGVRSFLREILVEIGVLEGHPPANVLFDEINRAFRTEANEMNNRKPEVTAQASRRGMSSVLGETLSWLERQLPHGTMLIDYMMLDLYLKAEDTTLLWGIVRRWANFAAMYPSHFTAGVLLQISRLESNPVASQQAEALSRQARQAR